MDTPVIISEKEYNALWLKFFQQNTLTKEEYDKLEAYEKDLEQDSVSSNEKGHSRTLSTPAGRAWADNDKKEAAFISSVLIVLGVTALGIITAFIAFGIGK